MTLSGSIELGPAKSHLVINLLELHFFSLGSILFLILDTTKTGFDK